MIKLIMSDMDGTLLDEHGNLPPRFEEVMEKLHQRGILFAPASGRQYYCLLRLFERYADSFVFVAENGSYVVYQGKEIFSAGLDKQMVKELLDIAGGIPETKVVLCGKHSAYVLPDENPAFFTEISKYYAEYRVVDSFDEVEDEILKIAIGDLSREGAEVNTYPHFAHYRDNCRAVVSGKMWIDLMNPNVNKGVASAHIQERFGITPEECMAFGDYMNDAEMLKTVKYSYAMDNAHPEIKTIARFQAKSNQMYGVLEAIEEMLEEKEESANRESEK